MKQEARKRFLKRCRSLKGEKTNRDPLYNEDEIMSKNKLHQFRKINNQNKRDSKDSENKNYFKKETLALYEELVENTNLDFNIEKSLFVISPDSQWKVIWDLFGMLFIIYQGVVVPFRICFDSKASGGFAIFELLQDFFFLFDIILTANSGYYEKGDLILIRSRILINYLKLWFWLDIAASFPYSLLINTSEFFDISGEHNTTDVKGPQILRLLKFMRFMRVLRLIRVLKLKKILIKFEELLMSDTFDLMISFGKLFFIVLIVAHWGACFWFYIGINEYEDKGYSWITRADILDGSIIDQYISSIYYYITTMTTVGYGDIVPVTNNERLYSMFSMILACGIFAYVIGSIGTFLSSRFDEEMIFKQKIMYVDQFLRNNNMNKFVRIKVRRYLEHVLERKREQKIDEAQVLELLNKNLKEEIIMHLNGLLLNNGTFSCLSRFDEFCLMLTSMMKVETLNPGDVIFHKGDLSLRLYFINSGIVTIYDQETKLVFKELDSKFNYGSFGEIGFFSGMRRSTSAESLTFVKITYIFLNVFKEMAYKLKQMKINKFREFEEEINTLRKEIRQKNYSKLKTQCYLCSYELHIAPDCPRLKNMNDFFKFKFIDRKHRTEQELKKIYDLLNKKPPIIKNDNYNDSDISEPSFTKNTEEVFFSNLSEVESNEFEESKGEENNDSIRTPDSKKEESEGKSVKEQVNENDSLSVSKLSKHSDNDSEHSKSLNICEKIEFKNKKFLETNLQKEKVIPMSQEILTLVENKSKDV